MMSNKEDKLNKAAQLLRNISLQADEKQAARSQLENHIDTNTPTQWVDLTRLVRIPFQRAAFAAVVAVFIIGGVTSAAQDALPGSALYTVKTNINEPFMSFLAWSDSQQAETESKLAARRIAELQELLNENKLTTSTSEKLLSRISFHTQAARQQIAELESAANAKDTQAQELRSRLQALLAVEGQKLQEFMQTSTTSTSTDNQFVQEAARELTDLAQANTPKQATTSKPSDLTAGGRAVLDLLSVTVDQMQSSYHVYLQRHDPASTAPPKELVSSAYDLDSAVDDINAQKYSQAVESLQETLESLDVYAANTSGITMQTDQSTISTSAAPVRERGAETTASTTVGSTSSTGSDNSIDEAELQTPSTNAPTRQALHNDTIQEAITKAKDVLAKYSFDTQNSDNNEVEAMPATSTASSSDSQTKQATTTDTAATTSASSSAATSSNDESAM